MQNLETILLVEDLVEDNPNHVEPTLDALAAKDIVVVNDGEATLDYPYWRGRFAGRESSPAVVLLDLKIPKLDGLAVRRTVKADPDLKPIPI